MAPCEELDAALARRRVSAGMTEARLGRLARLLEAAAAALGADPLGYTRWALQGGKAATETGFAVAGSLTRATTRGAGTVVKGSAGVGTVPRRLSPLMRPSGLLFCAASRLLLTGRSSGTIDPRESRVS